MNIVPFNWKACYIVISLNLSISVTVVGVLNSASNRQSYQTDPIQIGVSSFSRAEYERLKLDIMTRADVESILGRGTEIYSSKTTAIVVWRNTDNSWLSVTFENGKLKGKAFPVRQCALKQQLF